LSLLDRRSARDLHSFPTRRSSDLDGAMVVEDVVVVMIVVEVEVEEEEEEVVVVVLGGTVEDVVVVLLGGAVDVVEVEEEVVQHRSEEHTSELQSLTNLVCRLLLEK